MIPFVIEKTQNGERSYDIYSRLLKDRIIILSTGIDDQVAAAIIAQMLFLESDAPDRDIGLYIQSPGGYVSAGMAIYDTMQYIACDVSTICIGQAASMGALLLAAGTKGKRYALPHSRIMIHQPMGGFQGQASDVEIHAKEMLRTKEALNKVLADHTGKALDQVAEDTDRDYFMTPEEAQEYGIIDHISRKRVSQDKKEQ